MTTKSSSSAAAAAAAAAADTVSINLVRFRNVQLLVLGRNVAALQRPCPLTKGGSNQVSNIHTTKTKPKIKIK